MTSVITREERLALLAAASGDELVAADACLAAAPSFAVVTGKVLGAGGERAVAGTGPFFGTAVSPLTGGDRRGVGRLIRCRAGRGARAGAAGIDLAARPGDGAAARAGDLQGVAVLAVLHDLDALRRLATRVIRMESG